MLTKEDFAEALNHTVNEFLSVVDDKDYIIAPEVVFLPTNSKLLDCVSTPDNPQNLTTQTFKEDFPNGVFVFRTKLPANWQEAKYLISFEGCFFLNSGAQPNEPGIYDLSMFIRWVPSLLTERGKKELVPLMGEDLYESLVKKFNEITELDTINYSMGYEPDYRKNKEGFIEFVIKLNKAMQSLVTPSV